LYFKVFFHVLEGIRVTVWCGRFVLDIGPVVHEVSICLFLSRSLSIRALFVPYRGVLIIGEYDWEPDEQGFMRPPICSPMSVRLHVGADIFAVLLVVFVS
jgi:hypothetical protein